jgi:hypothetical protein
MLFEDFIGDAKVKHDINCTLNVIFALFELLMYHTKHQIDIAVLKF